MGLFGKTGKDNVDIDVANYSGAGANPMAPQADQTIIRNNNFKSPASSNYGIKDAIQLIRELPNVNSDIVITVVRKTLESANIQVNEIIRDAEQREQTIESRTGQLTSKIDQLETEIAKLNKEITQLNSDHEETVKVRELLLRSIEQDNSVNVSASSGAASAASNTTGAGSSSTSAQGNNPSSNKQGGKDMGTKTPASSASPAQMSLSEKA